MEDLSDEERDALIEEMIQFQLLAGAATDAGLTLEQDIAIDLELQRLQTLSRLMATRHLDENPITSLELQDAYEQNLDALSGVQYKARHILVDQEPEAVEIIGELQGGADFAQLAMERSTGPSGPNGGDLGLVFRRHHGRAIRRRRCRHGGGNIFPATRADPVRLARDSSRRHGRPRAAGTGGRARRHRVAGGTTEGRGVPEFVAGGGGDCNRRLGTATIATGQYSI